LLKGKNFDKKENLETFVKKVGFVDFVEKSGLVLVGIL
jgi:hypothetical protein